MDFDGLTSFLKNNGRLLLSSLTLAIVFGLFSFLGPQPKITTLILKNHENFFSIPSLKIVKAEYQVKAPQAALDLDSQKLQNFITKVTIYPDWLRKNIVLNYALSKEDAKELVDNTGTNDRDLDQNTITEAADARDPYALRNQTKVSRYKIANLSIEIQNFNDKFAREAAAWIGMFLINLNEYIRYQDLVEYFRSENEKILLNATTMLPNVELSLNALEAHITKVKELIAKNPELARQSVGTQLSVSTESMIGSESILQANPREKLYRPSEQITYLPLQTQLAGLEVQQAQTKSLLERLRFKIFVASELASASAVETERLSSLPIKDIEQGKINEEEFFKSANLRDASLKEDAQWKKNYIESILQDISHRVIILKQQSRAQAMELGNISSRNILQDNYSLAISVLLGLLIPVGWRFVPRIFSKIYS